MSLLALMLIAQAAPGADTVVLLRSTDLQWRPFEERVAAELTASGFDVKAVESNIDVAGDVPAQLWERCTAFGALAAVWFAPRGDAKLDAWVVDAVTAKAVLRTWDRPVSVAERARAALRAVELLHASLLEVRLMAPIEQEAVPDVARAVVDTRLRAEEKPHWVFGTGVGMIASPGGGVRTQPLLELQLGYAFRPTLAAEVQVTSSVWPARVEGAHGSVAEVGVAFLRAQGIWSPLRVDSFSVGLIVGTGALLLWASGQASQDGLDAQTDAAVTWVVSGGLVASLRMNEGIRLQLLATVGVCMPEVAVQLVEMTEARFGRPMVDALVRLEFE